MRRRESTEMRRRERTEMRRRKRRRRRRRRRRRERRRVCAVLPRIRQLLENLKHLLPHASLLLRACDNGTYPLSVHGRVVFDNSLAAACFVGQGNY
jgi:hypothetical protein